jgi:YgiT-type zinc finger domain-containing protein
MNLQDEIDGPTACAGCGGPLRAEVAQMPMWLGSELKLIDGVPVRVCDRCDRQHFAPRVEAAIRRLAGEGFPDRRARRQVLVPVFELEDFAEAAPSQMIRVAAE